MIGFFDTIRAIPETVKEMFDSLITGLAPLMFILAILFINACDNPPSVAVPTQFFQGEHELFPMDNGGFSMSTGGIMVFVDGFMVDSATPGYQKSTAPQSPPTATPSVQFMWKNNKDQFVMSALPLSKVRFQVSDSNYQSYCKFRWFDNNFNESRWQDNVVYVIFVLKPDQIKFKKVV